MAGINDFEMMLPNFLNSAENIITYFDEDKDQRDQYLENLNSAVKSLCVAKLKAKKITETTKEVFHNINNENFTSKDIMKIFQENKAKILEYQPNENTHAGYKEFCQQVKEIIGHADGVKKKSAHEDDDIEMTQNDINIIDPFTKMKMTDPVKNKICGHVYDRNSLTQILKMHPNTKCPVIGCNNRNVIDINNIITDIVTRKYLHDNP